MVLGVRRTSGATTTRHYLLVDGLGSVVAVTDGSGSVVATKKYDPYGNTTAATGTFAQPIGYAGGYTDDTTGSGPTLIKFGQRYYDPSIGRWTQLDPLHNPLDLHGWNGYIYAGDDPVNFTDLGGTSISSWLGTRCHSLAQLKPWCHQAWPLTNRRSPVTTNSVRCRQLRRSVRLARLPRAR